MAAKVRVKKIPSVVMWMGFGVVSPRGLYLEAYAEGGEYVLRRLEDCPRGHRFVVVTARLERATRRQIREAEGVRLGFARKGRG